MAILDSLFGLCRMMRNEADSAANLNQRDTTG